MNVHSTRDRRAACASQSLRTAVCIAIAAVVFAGAACGKKGPPLAPFVRVPATATNVTAQRIGSDVYLSIPIPSTNVDGQQPADIAAIEVYAVTSLRPPATEKQRDVAALIATLPVRPLLPDLPPPVDGSPTPPIPVPPGVDRGTTAVVRETLSADAMVAVELPAEQPRSEGEEAGEAEGFVPIGPLVVPPPTEMPQRHYFVVGVSPRGRKSAPSTPIAVPLETVASAPSAPKVDYTEASISVQWEPPADARTATLAAPTPPAAAKPAGNRTPDGVEPAPAPQPPLPARSLGFSTEATLYHLYEVSSNASPADPYAITLPAPLTPAPVAVTEWAIAGVTFGVQRCFEVRPVDKVGAATVIGPASPATCITITDTFAPAAPRSLAAIAGSGSINLIWDANTEKDVAGYLVLRAEAPSDVLQPITQEPVAAATYRDATVTPGARYVYSVVAVDSAGNRSAESNRIEETARQ